MSLESILHKIARQLLINSSFTQNIGLSCGKCGAIIFFYMLERSVHPQKYDVSSIADSLIDEILEDVHTKSPADIDDGLTGMGIAIEYLIKEGFVAGTSDDILDDIDKQLFRYRQSVDCTTEIVRDSYAFGLYAIHRTKSIKQIHTYKDFEKLESILYLIDDCSLIIKKSHCITYKMMTSIYAFLLFVLQNGIQTDKIENMIYESLNCQYDSNTDLYSDKLSFKIYLEKIKEYTLSKELRLSIDRTIKKIHGFSNDWKNMEKDVCLKEISNLALLSILYDHINFQECCPDCLYDRCLSMLEQPEWWDEALKTRSFFIKDGFAGIGIALLLKKDSSRKSQSSIEADNKNFQETNSQPDQIIYDFTNLTVGIPVRIDSKQRVRNLEILIGFLRNKIKTNILIIEEGYTSQIPESIKKDVQFVFVPQEQELFHRTKYINQMLSLTNTVFFACWDTDVLISEKQLEEAMHHLVQEEYDFVLPYNGLVRKVGTHLADIIHDYQCFSILYSLKDMMTPFYGFHSMGGVYIVNVSKYKSIGGENEDFICWGPEDIERIKRAENFHLKIYRCKGEAFHLEHPKGVNSKPCNGINGINMGNALLKSCRI